MHSSASEVQNVDTLFFMLWWDRYEFDKKHIRTHYAEPMFLHSVGYAGHIVHFGASGMRNVDTLFFILRWDQCGYDKKWTRTHYS
jgi:hypothetical protein